MRYQVCRCAQEALRRLFQNTARQAATRRRQKVIRVHFKSGHGGHHLYMNSPPGRHLTEMPTLTQNLQSSALPGCHMPMDVNMFVLAVWPWHRLGILVRNDMKVAKMTQMRYDTLVEALRLVESAWPWMTTVEATSLCSRRGSRWPLLLSSSPMSLRRRMRQLHAAAAAAEEAGKIAARAGNRKRSGYSRDMPWRAAIRHFVPIAVMKNPAKG